jgi:predicted nucleic acid-binding protein
MILVDTSIWVDHIRGRTTPLDDVLGHVAIVLHPFVLGELLLNGLPKTGGFSQAAFSRFAKAPLASPAEVAAFIATGRSAGTGIGYLDAHLLVSAQLLPGGSIMTADQDLRAQAERLGLAYAS